MEAFSLLEAIWTQRSIRRFNSDPVPDEVITRIIEAATRAPSRGNAQPWHFLVVRNAETKGRIGKHHQDSTADGRKVDPSPERFSSPLYHASDYIVEHMNEVPVVILLCVNASAVSQLNGAAAKAPFTGGASIYPAMQNLMLAARGLGLGTGLMTFYRNGEEPIKAMLGIPADVEIAALILAGYPGEGEHFGGSRRKPVGKVTFYERWGQQYP